MTTKRKYTKHKNLTITLKSRLSFNGVTDISLVASFLWNTTYVEKLSSDMEVCMVSMRRLSFLFLHGHSIAVIRLIYILDDGLA